MILLDTIKYKVLNRQHPEYKRELFENIELLHTGGPELIANAERFITPMPGESPNIHADRMSCATYNNYAIEHTSDYTYSVFTKSLAVSPSADPANPETPVAMPNKEFWEEFASNADLAGNTLNQVMQRNFTEALKFGRMYIGQDYPKIAKDDVDAEEKTLSVADVKDTNIRGYLYDVPTMSVINWHKDEFGDFTDLTIKHCFDVETFLVDGVQSVIQFKVWYVEDGVVKYGIYEKKYDANVIANDEDDFNLIDDDIVDFPKIPINELEMPKQLWLMLTIYLPLIELFRLTSALIYAELKALYEVPFYTVGDPSKWLSLLGDDRGYKALNEFKSRGITVGAEGDDFKFVGPDGKVFTIMNEQIKDREMALNRTILNQGTQSQKKGTIGGQASGVAKMMDNQAKEKILSAYGQLLMDLVKKIYSNFDPDTNWEVKGLTNYSVIDQDKLMARVTASPIIQKLIPSETFWAEYSFDLSKQLLELNPDTQAVVRAECVANVASLDLQKAYKESVNPPPDPVKNKE